MSGTQGWGMVMAIAGALLVGAIGFIVALVLDLPVALMWLLTLIGAVAGAWYGMRLTKVAARRQRVEEEPGRRRH